MPQQPPQNERPATQISAQEYRRIQMAKAQRRKKQRQKKMLVLGAFVLAGVILIVCLVMAIRSAFGKKDDSSLPSTTSQAEGIVGGGGNTMAADPNAWNLLLVNAENPLPEGFEQPELESIAVGQVAYWFDPRIIDPLQQMIADCNANEGYSLTINSGYRGWNTQTGNHSYYVTLYTDQGNDAAEAERLASRLEPVAGATDHHTGLAVDFITNNVTDTIEAFQTTAEYQWLLEHAADYGFVLRYPANKTDVTGVDFQPYHWRYVGADDAHVMNGAGVCLEEYVGKAPASAPTGADTDPDESIPEDSSTPPESVSGAEE